MYSADENALCFTTLPRPDADRPLSVQIKRMPLDEPGEVSMRVAEAIWHRYRGSKLNETLG